MPLLRGRRDDGGTKYRMREKLFDIGDDYWIENEDGERAFKVDGKALRVRDMMEVEHAGQTVASVKKAMIAPLRDRFSIGVEECEDMEAKGNVVDHEYKIERGGDKVAEVSKCWFRIRDTYGIEIAPGPDGDSG